MDNYNGTTVDRRGQTDVAVTVGAAGNGGNLAFSPAAIHVTPGTTVTFEWTGQGGSHTVRHEHGAFDTGDAVGRAGATFEVTFETSGVYRYYCAPHRMLGMKGVVVVGQSREVVTTPDGATGVYPESERQTATLVGSDTDQRDSMGKSITMSGDGRRVLVGAHRDEDPHGMEAGTAYVFARTDEGWREESKLVAEDGDPEDWFGWDVALDYEGTRALVSAYTDEDPNGPNGGAVYEFERTTDGWQQQSKFTALDGDEKDRFGSSLALTGDGSTALVGAWRAGDDSSTGVAYIFDGTGGSWTQTARLVPDSQRRYGAFGRVVGLDDDGETAVVGADGEQAAYVFERDGGTWRQQKRLTTPVERSESERNEDRFGSAVALAGNGSTALVGTDQSVNAANPGYVVVYSRSATGWQRETTVAPAEGDPGDKFGGAVSLSEDGDTALVGAPNSNRYGENAGAATLFTRTENGWDSGTRLRARDTDTYDDFGIALTLADDGASGAIGARDKAVGGVDDVGAAYVFADLLR